MFKHRLKSPYLCLFWALPLLAALGHDITIWQINRTGFHFSEIGYLLQHYTPYHDKVVEASDLTAYSEVLRILFNAKAVMVGLIIALPSILWINRRQHKEEPKAFLRIRR